MQWTLAQMRTFAVVAELGTMTAAATRLGYTPGAVSQHMSALQRACGARLHSPVGRRVALTEAGRALLPRVQAVLAAEAQAAEVMAGGDSGPSALVTVGVFGSASAVSFAVVRQRLAAAGIDLRAREVDVEQMQAAVATGRIDVGIGVDYPSSPLAPVRGVRMRQLRAERFDVVAPRGADLTRARSGREEVSEEAEWVLPPHDSTFGRAFRFALAELGIAPRETHIVVDTAVTLAMVADGAGLSLATPSMLALATRPVDVVTGTACGGRDIVAMTRPELDGEPGVSAVVDALAHSFG